MEEEQVEQPLDAHINLKNKVQLWQLRQRQGLPLSTKLKLTQNRIQQWYEHWNGDVSVSVSGGLDSTVLVHIVQEMYPNVPAYFADTGLEYPENREFVFNHIKNLVVVKPKKSFRQVVLEHGYPIVSKRVAEYIEAIQRGRAKKGEQSATYKLRMTGIKTDGTYSQLSKLSDKWQYLIDAPFKISAKCCNYLKKNPLSVSPHPFTGSRAEEAGQREKSYLQFGCNLYDAKTPISNPIAFWLGQDVLDYIKMNNLPYSKLYDMGYTRSGCAFCMFGCHLEQRTQNIHIRKRLPGPLPLTRFQVMKTSHPKLWNYCIHELGLKEPLEHINVKYDI